MFSTDYFPPSRLNPGRAWFVAPLDDDRSGLSWNTARNNIQAAVDLSISNDVIYVAPGTYTEQVIVPVGLSISIIGVGPINSVILKSTTAGATTLTDHGDNCLIQNLNVLGADTSTAIALRVTASNSRFLTCKLQGAFQQVVVGPGLNALVTASTPTQGQGIGNFFYDCELSDGPKGLILHGTDFGPASRTYVQSCYFNRLSTLSVGEENASGSASNQFRNFLLKESVFMPAQDGTEPTNYVLLNASNSNSGLLTRNHFTVAQNSGKNLVSTKAIWTANYHPLGLSTGQPS